MGSAELDPRILLLGGVAVGAFAAAITTALVSLAEATELRNAFLWLWVDSRVRRGRPCW